MSIARHFVRLQVRIETIAENESVPGETGLSLEATLAALTARGRRRVTMLLEHVRAFSTDPDEQAAAGHIRELAEHMWARTPSDGGDASAGYSSE
jgi:hypothetical protein